jgi:serine/threonine protein kinase
MSDHINQKLGNYRLIRMLGQGGFADVYLGEHIYLKTPAAIKLLQTRLAQDDLQSFLNEARSIANLVHPNIVRILEFGVEGSIPFLVMDYAPNGTLRQRHPKGSQVLPAFIARYIKQVAAALQYAHDQRVVHRDIKPENMLLGRNNEVLLSDFGIAVVAQTSRYHQVGQEIGGTIAYMAPEQLQGRAVPASDQYALGIVTYEWLSGDRPFLGSFPEIASQHMLTPPAPLQSKIPGIPKDIEEVVMRALAKDPQQRFMRVEAFANALEHACQGAPPLVIPSAQPSPVGDTTLPGQSPSPNVAVTPQIQFPSGNYGIFPPGQATPNYHGTPPPPPPPPGQSSPGFASMPTYQSPPAPGSNLSPGQFQQTPRNDKDQSPNKGIPRRVVVAGLAGLAGVVILGGGLAFVAHTFQPQGQNGTTGTSTTPTSNASTNNNNQATTPTEVPTDTPTTDPNVTPTPTLAPTVQTTPGQVLYVANFSNGLDGWSGTGDWKSLKGSLLNDGTNKGAIDSAPTILVPTSLIGIANYAVEAVIQVQSFSNYAPSFGFVLRAADAGYGYMAGIGTQDYSLNTARISDLSSNDFFNSTRSSPFDPGLKAHTYRVEIKDNDIKLLIDGGLAVELFDNKYLTGERTGLWCANIQLSIHSYKVVAL